MKWFGLMEERVLSGKDVYPIVRDYRKTELFSVRKKNNLVV
jgi:hypothetical protein